MGVLGDNASDAPVHFDNIAIWGAYGANSTSHLALTNAFQNLPGISWSPASGTNGVWGFIDLAWADSDLGLKADVRLQTRIARAGAQQGTVAEVYAPSACDTRLTVMVFARVTGNNTAITVQARALTDAGASPGSNSAWAYSGTSHMVGYRYV